MRTRVPGRSILWEFQADGTIPITRSLVGLYAALIMNNILMLILDRPVFGNAVLLRRGNDPFNFAFSF